MAKAATQLKDPIADLMAEIEAEETQSAQTVVKTAAPVIEEQTDDEASEQIEAVAAEEEGEAAQEAKTDTDTGDQPAKEAEKLDEEKVAKPKKGKGKSAEDEGWRSRLNEEAVKRRQAEKAAEDLRRELEALKNPKKPDEPKKQPTIEEIREQVRQEERWNMRVADFVGAGHKEYTEPVFEAACNRIAEVVGHGKPSNIIGLAMDATDTTAQAAKAVLLLGQMDVPEIEKFFAQSEYKQVATLTKLGMSRRTKQEDEPAPKPKSKRVEQEDDPPRPIRPVNGSVSVPDGMQALYNEDTDEQRWYKEFESTVMNKGAAH